MKREFKLSLESVIPYLKQELSKMQAEKDRNQLEALTPDYAFELGYDACIKDVEMLMGDDPQVMLTRLNAEIEEELKKVGDDN